MQDHKNKADLTRATGWGCLNAAAWVPECKCDLASVNVQVQLHYMFEYSYACVYVVLNVLVELCDGCLALCRKVWNWFSRESLTWLRVHSAQLAVLQRTVTHIHVHPAVPKQVAAHIPCEWFEGLRYLCSYVWPILSTPTAHAHTRKLRSVLQFGKNVSFPMYSSLPSCCVRIF